MPSKGRGAIKPCFKLRGQWGERTCDFFQSFVCCSLSVFRSSSENCLFIDLNHISKQRVHVRELMHQAREFCLKWATNYISKGRGAIKAYFKLRGQWGERRCDFFQSFVCCSFSVFRSSSENWLFIDLNRKSKQHVHVRELSHQAREFCLKRAIHYISLIGSGAQNRVLDFAGSEVEGLILFLYCLLTLFNALSGMWFLLKEVNSCSNKRL